MGDYTNPNSCMNRICCRCFLEMEVSLEVNLLDIYENLEVSFCIGHLSVSGVHEVPFYDTSDERIIEIQGDGQKKVELKVFVYRCDGCKCKVKKLLQSIEGIMSNIISCFDINNEGIMCSPFELSVDGVELQFATNYLGHFLLTKLLLDNLKTTAKETGREGRVVNVSSVAHKFTQSSDWTSLDNLNDPKKYKAYDAYCRSELSNVLQANELSTRLQEGANVTANSLHPGFIPPNLARYVQL
ncbi:hypothetical protein GIB67_042041 [Kingdonia uniflora]|uniref:Uncharacterized protein n=1 Tax=Kingdonia uniflora TaxID=39325 RepID=A0A7J7MW06_9MAGN|nr:hypothetical protein GIB67_042041 [Kingdonia uniflora]